LPPIRSNPFTATEELLRVGQEYADLFNARPLDDIDGLIADACVDPFWDDRTNLLSMLAGNPESLGLVLATSDEDYVIIRFVDRWVVDTGAVDWEALEENAYAAEDEGDSGAAFDLYEGSS
jgi:hypothetical protein